MFIKNCRYVAGWDKEVPADGFLTRGAKVRSRDIPVGVLGSLAICAVLYVTVALVMTSLAHYTHLGGAAPMIAIRVQPELARSSWSEVEL